MIIKRMDGETITTTATPTDINAPEIADAKYATSPNRVVDITTTKSSTFVSGATLDAAIAHTTTAGRTSIKYTNT